MKVKVKDLKPNPFRDVNNYPMNEEKVRMLAESIKQTGFWDNILARKQNGGFQIAYGHHRLAAVREVFKPTDEVDIPVKELSDALMIKIMANENMDDWKATPQVIDETVRVTKRFLEEHPEEVKKVTPTGATPGIIGGVTICKFLGWNKTRVRYSLERLGLIEDGIIDETAIKELDTDGAARNFVDVVEKYNIPKHKQKAVIDRYKEKGGGEIGMREAAMEVQYAPPKKKSPEQIIRIEGVFADIDARADDLIDGMKKLLKACQEIGGTPTTWNGINWKVRLGNTLQNTKKEIDNFLNEI